jgi:hypothetical protein
MEQLGRKHTYTNEVMEKAVKSTARLIMDRLKLLCDPLLLNFAQLLYRNTAITTAEWISVGLNIEQVK